MSVADLTEQLAQTEQLVVQLKELIREKDNELRKKDQQLKEEKETLESKVSKAKLQSKAKVASLSSQLEELKKQLASSNAPEIKADRKKGSGDSEQESASANRGKILLLRKRVEELESQLSAKNEDIQRKEAELESQRLRGSELDTMLAEKQKKLAEKEAYIIDLQVSAGANLSKEAFHPEENIKNQVTQKDSSQEDLQLLIQNLTRKVGDSEERCSLLQEQAESLKSLLQKERSHFQEREAMYMENIRVFQGITQTKEKELQDQAQKHEQEVFKLLAKSDASADLHQLLKALKQKLHEEEEVLSGKNQVIDVLQKELDNKEHECKEISEKCKRLQSEKENLQSKLDAEKHVMRAQLRDLMEKHNTELQGIKEKHQGEMQEKGQFVLHLQKQLQDLGSSGAARTGLVESSEEAILNLQEEVKLKTEEASKSEAKFLKMKAWSKSKIRQLEEELKTVQFEIKQQDISVLNSRVCELENEKRELLAKLHSVSDLQSLNEELLAKLVIYEEQQRKMQADLEQVTKRADSQTSESGSVDELHNQLLEWNEMTPETEGRHVQGTTEKSILALRMEQMEEDREAMDSGQQELEEELNAARGMVKMRQSRRKGSKGSTKLQDEFDFSRKSFEDQNTTLESVDSAEGENMGGLRIVVEELEIERNQLQEQIMTLEERCQELEDRLQLQARIESLQSENERLQVQLTQLRQLHSRETEKHHDLVSTINQQLKGLTDRNAFLENAIVEKEQIILEATGKLEQMGTIKKSLQDKEVVNKDLSEKLEQTEQKLVEVTKKQIATAAENAALKESNGELEKKVSAYKERVLKQDAALEKLQLDLEQTNEELDRLNTSHLEERSQLILDLQRCEREMDVLKEVLQDKDKELSSLSASLTEYAEQVGILKEQMYFKEEQMREMSEALVKADRENYLLREAETSDVQETNARISSLSQQLHEMEGELIKAKHLNEGKTKEAEELIVQINENGTTIKNLRLEIQAQSVKHNNHVTECSTQIASLKEQINTSIAKCEEMEKSHRKEMERLRSQLEEDRSERAKLAGLLEEKNSKEQKVEKELKLAKEQYNQVISGISRKDEDLEQLSKELAEQRELREQVSKELQCKQEELSTLQRKLETVIQRSEEELKALQENAQELQTRIRDQSDRINKLDVDKNELCAQNQQLQDASAQKEQQLTAQVNTVEELKQSLHDLEEKHQLLCSEKEELRKNLSCIESEMSSLSQAVQEAQRKVTTAEQLLAEEQQAASTLVREKEELLQQVTVLTEQSLQKDKLVHEQLEERANECLGLQTSLTEEQELSQGLKLQIKSLEDQLKETQQGTQDKEDALQAKVAECTAVSQDLNQYKEKYSVLHKEIEALQEDVEKKKRALQEKDLVITTQNAHAEEASASMSKLQHEEHNLREVNVRLTKQVEEVTSSLVSHRAEQERLQQELGHKLAENNILNGTLEILTREAEALKQEKAETLLLVSKSEEQRDGLQSQLLQKQSEADLLKQQIETLKGENEKLNSSCELTNTALASKSEEIHILSSHLSQQGHKMLSLKDQIDTLLVEKQALVCNVEEKDALLRQKEELIQQTEKKLEGEGHYLQTISTMQNELQHVATERNRLQQLVDDKELEIRQLGQNLKMFRDKSEEAALLKTQLAEHVEIISDLHSQIKMLRENTEALNITGTEREESLKQKLEEYVHLQAQFSEVQGSFHAQKIQIEKLISENEHYKTVINDKDVALQKSSLNYADLKQQEQSKASQCADLMQQVTQLETTSANLNRELNELKVVVKGQEASLSEREALLISHLEARSLLVTGLEARVQELTSTLKHIEQTSTEKEITIHNLQDKYASLYDQKSELDQSLSRKEEELTRLVHSVREKDVSLMVSEKNVQALTNEIELLREELEKKSSNLNTLSITLKEKDDVNAVNQQAMQTMKAELDSLRVEYEKSVTQLHKVTEEIKEKELSLQSLQEKCNSQSQHVERLNAELNHLNVSSVQVQHDHLLHMEQLQLQLESTEQEKLRIEQASQEMRAQNERSAFELQKKLAEQAEIVKDQEAKLELLAKESAERMLSGTLQLETERADLQKQVSEKLEEICELKLKIEALGQDLAERQEETHRLKEQSESLSKHSHSLEQAMQGKENNIQALLKDLHFVEEQLGLLCDEDFPESSALHPHSDYQSNVERFSSLFSVALNHKSSLVELKQTLVTKESDCAERSQLLMSLESERALLQTELQKVKYDCYSLMEEIAAIRNTNAQQQCLLNEKEDVLSGVNALVAQLQEELRQSKDEFQQRLCAMEEGGTKMLELVEDIKRKDVIIQNLNVQLTQQKELISALSGQIKDKDASLAQVMESMSNEMLKISEERKMLNSELENAETAKRSCLLELEKVSAEFTECKIQLEEHQNMAAEKETAASRLQSEKDLMQHQVDKLGKEKDNLKRKLQAALVIRKELMQRMEKLEVSKQEELQSEQHSTEELRKTVDELNSKLNSVCSQKEEIDSHVQLVTKELQERERRADELDRALGDKERLVEELQNTILTLQCSLSQREDACQEHLRAIQEKDAHLQEVQDAMNERVKSLQEEILQLRENMENLRSHLQAAQEKIEDCVLESGRSDLDPTAQVDAVHLRQENTIVHNNVHGSLSCSDGSLNLTNQDQATLTERESLNINELEQLKVEHSYMLNMYEAKCKEYDLSLEQVQHLQQELLERESQLCNRDRKLEEQRMAMEGVLRQLQKMEQFENTVLDLKSLVQDQEFQLLQVNSERTNLLNECETLQAEIQKQSANFQSKLQEIQNLKTSVLQLEQYEKDKEMMTAEIILLQNNLETSKKELESIQRTAQQMSLDKETYVEALRMDQIESEKLRHELKLSNLVLLEREKTIAHLQDSLQKMTAVSEEESRTLNSRLADSREEADKLKSALDRLKEETEESAGKLGKAKVEISNLKTKLVDSGKEEALALQQSSAPTHKNRAEIESQQGTVHQVTAVCESCSKKERVIVELENQVMQTNKTMRELREKHIKDAKEQENRQTEESSSKEQLQRKLQAALLSRKDILKENKSLKQKVDSLSVETDALKLSLHKLQEQKNAEISALEQTKENILSENARLVMVNENLSAACESLKSTMETIVQEKEAFSFQLNSLKDSQTVELSGWKAKHGELNKEYESLLQAYENISDEIDKMRQVIESTKKEKYEILQRFHEAQAENTKLRTQAEENNQERDALRSSLESRAKETQLLQSEAERLSDLLKSSTEEQYLTDEESRQNTQLMEQNCQLQENCESLKLLLENEKENHARLITEATQDIKSEMDMYISEAENKISDLRSEKELLSSKLAELSRELMESKKQLGDSSAERSDILERLGNIELALKQEKRALMERESDLNKMHLENMSLIEKVKILEDDKSLLQEEIENVQEQFYKVKNEREHLGTELLDAVKKNEQLIDKFKSLQVQTNFLSQQVESLRAEKNSIMRDKEDERLQILREFEARAKSTQNDTSGTRSKSRELQELLKEKQQEINQLQRDSIKFQELILDLEGSVKDSRTQNASLQEELEKARKDTQSLNKELSANRRLLERSKDDIRVLTSELKASPNVDITDRKQNLLPALAESEMLPSPAKPGFKDDSQVINRETIKQKIHMQHESPIHNIGQSNGIPTSRLLERESVQGKENQSNNDLENKMRVLQKEIVKKEQDFQQLLLERERLRADLEKQLTISQHMKQVINNKDTEISVLISSKDGEISSYVAEIQEQYRKRAENHELQLSSLQAQKQRSEEDCRRTEAELRDFQTKYDKALNDKIQLSNEVEAFRKSMSSLQTDRDLLCTELKSVQHQHETVLGQKDAIILNVTSENHHLKQELRKLLNQTDDLNAENAMLGAQLLRYREDLNQVLSLKDNQLKELLRQKLDHIKNLEEEKCDLQKQNREVQNEIGLRKQAVEAAELENQKLTSKVRDQEALIAAINKDKMMSYSRKKKDSRAGIEGVQQQNVSDHNSSHVIERGYNMDSGEQDNDLLEKQVNTTEKNLARSYWDIYHENKELLSQNETFGKAMAALQNDRDALIEDFKVLQSRYASELKAETMRGDDLETQLQSFKSYICGVLKRNSLLNETLLSIDHHITLDELGAEVESLCSILSTRNLEVSQLSAECARYARQIDAFSKSMASLQHERERLVQQLRDAKQGSAATGIALSGNDSTMSRTQAYSDTVTPASESSSGVEFSKLRVKVEELEKMLQQARSLQDAAERETSSYQCELTELRSEKNLLVTETQALRHQLSDRLAEKDRQIAELYKTQQEAVTRNLYGAQNMERMALVGSPGFSENPKSRLDEQSPQKAEIQRYLQEIHQRDLVIQQINSKAMESVEINAVLSAQLKTVSQGLKDTQMKYSDLQNQYYKLQRNCQSTQESDLRAIRAEVPPSAPQERANVLVDIDNAELNDLRTRLAETEHHYDSMQQELSHLSERLTEERTRREAAEEALTLAEQQSKRLEMKTLSREYEFALQMESDDERESLIIDPTQHVVVRKVRGGALTLRRWLRGRSLYCSKLLTSRGKSRYLFLTYLLLLHGLILMCLTGVL